MPRLKCTFARFLEIILAHGFEFHRQGKGSHQRYRRELDGKVWMVDFAPHGMSDEIKAGTLDSMIRQSGLPKSLFRH